MEQRAEAYQHLVRGLVPINALSPSRQNEVIAQSRILNVEAGHYLFRQGDADGYNYYLLEGEVELAANGYPVGRQSADSDDSRYAIAQLRPRKFTVVTTKPSLLFRVDQEVVDMAADESVLGAASSDDGELERTSTGDWMTSMLRSELFARIPAMNLQRIFTVMAHLEVAAGDVVLSQGDPGDYYYMIHRGRCEVLVTPPSGQRAIKVAELTDGSSFGEEALVTDAPRNATIRMLSGGHLLRLGKDDFTNLIREPILDGVSFDEAESRVAGGASWLDIRDTEDAGDTGIPGAVKMPFSVLRMRTREIDPERPYIAYCEDGRRSAVAAFLLIQRGLEVSFLDGGLLSTPYAPESVMAATLAMPNRRVIPDEVDETPDAAPKPVAKSHVSVQAPEETIPRARFDALVTESEGMRTRLEEATRAAQSAVQAKRSLEKVVQEKLTLAKRLIGEEKAKVGRATADVERLKRELEVARHEAGTLEALKEEHARALAEERERFELDRREAIDGLDATWNARERELADDAEQLRDEVEKLQTELNEARARAGSGVETAPKEAEEQATAWRDKEAALLADRDRLARENERLAHELEQAESARTDSDMERESRHRAELRELEERLGREAADRLVDAEERSRREQSDLDASLERRNAENGALEARLEELEAVVSDERARAERAEKALAAAIARAEEAEHLIPEQDAEQRLAELEERLRKEQSELEASLERRNGDYKALESRLADLETAVSDERARAERAEAASALAIARAEEAERLIPEQDPEQRLAELEERLRQEQSELEASLERRNGDYKALESRLADVESVASDQWARAERAETALAAAVARAEEAERGAAEQRSLSDTMSMTAEVREAAFDRERQQWGAQVNEWRRRLEAAEAGNANATQELHRGHAETVGRLEDEKVALERQLADVVSRAREVDGLRDEVTRGRHAVAEAVQRQQRELEEVERILREEAEEALAAERARLEAEFEQRFRTAIEAERTAAPDALEVARQSVEEFLFGSTQHDTERTAEIEPAASDTLQGIPRGEPPQIGVAPEEDHAGRVIDADKLRNLMQRRRDSLKRRG